MAITQNTFTGNGSNLGPFTFTFKWLESTDVKVTVNGVLKTAGTHYNLQALNYTTKDGGQVLFTAGNAPAANTVIRIYRDTDDSALPATFFSGSAIRSQDLNDDFTQNLYSTQEVKARYLDRQSGEMEAVYVPATSTSVVTKGYMETNYGVIDEVGFTRWRQVATSGQTAFSGAGSYGNILSFVPTREQVYLNGALQQINVDYTTNTAGTAITFSPSLTAGDVVDVVCINNLVQNSTTNSDDLDFVQASTGAVTRSVGSKLRDVVSVKDFGAVGDGVTDDTAAFQAAYTAASANSTILIPFGQYNLTSSINNTKFVRWLSFGATYPGGTVPLSLPGIVETQLGRDLYRRTSTSATDSSILELQRIGSHTGGTNGFVTPAFQAYTSALAGSKNYEWAALAIIDNSSTLADGSENVAIYGQALKKADGKSWAGCLEIRDTHGAANALGDCIGLEITAVAQNLTTDTNYQRNGIHVATSSTGAGAAEWSRGFWTSTGGSARVRECFSNTGNFCKAVFRNSGVGTSTGVDTAKFIEDTGSSEIGIDLGNATYSSGIALRIPSGNYIYLDQTNANGIRVSGGIIQITGSRVRPSQGLDFSSGVSGLVTTSASAGTQTLPSNPAGFLSVWIDGSNFKLPYYGA